MAAPRKYGDELRGRATRMAVDARRDPGARSGAIPRIAAWGSSGDFTELGSPGRGRWRGPAGHHDRRRIAVGRA